MDWDITFVFFFAVGYEPGGLDPHSMEGIPVLLLLIPLAFRRVSFALLAARLSLLACSARLWWLKDVVAWQKVISSRHLVARSNYGVVS